MNEYNLVLEALAELGMSFGVEVNASPADSINTISWKLQCGTIFDVHLRSDSITVEFHQYTLSEKGRSYPARLTMIRGHDGYVGYGFSVFNLQDPECFNKITTVMEKFGYHTRPVPQISLDPPPYLSSQTSCHRGISGTDPR